MAVCYTRHQATLVASAAENLERVRLKTMTEEGSITLLVIPIRQP
jgi:hypothetical protein